MINTPDDRHQDSYHDLQDQREAMKEELIAASAKYLYEEALISNPAYQSLVQDYALDFGSPIQRILRNLEGAVKGDIHNRDGMELAAEDIREDLKNAARLQAESQYSDD
mgnify:CR=1 FL=1